MDSLQAAHDDAAPVGGASMSVGGDGALLISAYADARVLLASAFTQVSRDPGPPDHGVASPVGPLVERGSYLRGLWMWGCGPERRIARRKAAAAALGQGLIEGLNPYLRTQAAALLDAGGDGEEIDLVADFARPLVRDALMELFGIPAARREALEKQVGAMAGFVPGNSSNGTARYFALAATARLIEDAWAKPLPQSAGASQMLRAAVDAGELSLDEALAQATLLLFGNSYTTLDALAGLLARMAGQPELWQAARAGAVPVAGLVEESLRLGPPTHLTLFRETEAPIECPSGTIPAGRRIVLPLDRINRDPARFEHAERFDPGRSGPPHLAFGAGRHMCVGLHLARAVIRVGVETLLQRLPEWPTQTRVERAPGILGGPSVIGLTVPVGSLASC